MMQLLISYSNDRMHPFLSKLNYFKLKYKVPIKNFKLILHSSIFPAGAIMPSTVTPIRYNSIKQIVEYQKYPACTIGDKSVHLSSAIR